MYSRHSSGHSQGRFGFQSRRNDGHDLGRSLKPVNWDEVKLEPFQKLFLKEELINTKPKEVVDNYRKEHEIVIKDNMYPVPQPFINWEETFFPNYVQQSIADAKYPAPTPIQAQCFPIILSGHDLIGIAKTGSGKTLAFLLPAIVHINAQPAIKRGDGPIALVLAPTRELVMQIQEETDKFGRTSNLKNVSVYGGADKYPQMHKLQAGMDFVIACPGRLIDFLESNTTNLRRVTYLVLDEADRMLDMGFEPQIRKIISQIRPDRQTLMFSATWPREVQQLARDLCQEQPIYIQIGNYEFTVNDHIKQIVEILNESQKTGRLIKYLDSMLSTDKVLIFCATKRECESLSRYLTKETFTVMPIHGDKTQHDRDRAMDLFKCGKINILVATDVAQRGLDIKDITYVINFDCPKQIEDYIHRIGRTGRAGAYGTSITFMTYEEDVKMGRDIINVLRECNQEVPKELQDMCGGYRNNRGRDDYRSNNNYRNSSHRHSSSSNYYTTNSSRNIPSEFNSYQDKSFSGNGLGDKFGSQSLGLKLDQDQSLLQQQLYLQQLQQLQQQQLLLQQQIQPQTQLSLQNPLLASLQGNTNGFGNFGQSLGNAQLNDNLQSLSGQKQNPTFDQLNYSNGKQSNPNPAQQSDQSGQQANIAGNSYSELSGSKYNQTNGKENNQNGTDSQQDKKSTRFDQKSQENQQPN